ncbi:Hypothetical protein CINCED_3A018480 [Cinara cedri]|uniref:Reverse transcriptase n=1 Tax=Cinara cedri TaxID=506608 RepID=A0A5E4NBQ8_9HEMI|nr:Hypothetical protein CINCED_3A018480 [Cinara cedri]
MELTIYYESIKKECSFVKSENKPLIGRDIIKSLILKFIALRKPTRTIPSTFKDKIEKELGRVENEDVIRLVNNNDWGTPLVQVLKGNGAIQICDGLKKDPTKIEAVFRVPRPSDSHGIRALAGMINYYSRFVKYLSGILEPIIGISAVLSCVLPRAIEGPVMYSVIIKEALAIFWAMKK